jgi:hypothetical protein
VTATIRVTVFHYALVRLRSVTEVATMTPDDRYLMVLAERT